MTVESAPSSPNYWNTLGVALYHHRDYENSVVALMKSEALSMGRVDEADALRERTDALLTPEEFAADLFQRARQHHITKDLPQAMECYRRAAEVYADLADGEPDNRHLRFEQSRAQVQLGNLLHTTGQPQDEAIDLLRSAIAILEPFVDGEPAYLDSREQLGLACNKLAAVYQRGNRDLAEAEHWHRQAVAHLTQAMSLSPATTSIVNAKAVLWWSHWQLMRILAGSGRGDEAITFGLQAAAIEESLPDKQRRSLPSREPLVTLLRKAGRVEKADAVQRRSQALESEIRNPDSEAR